MIKLKDIVNEILTNDPPPAIVQQVPSIDANKIADAIYFAEGGAKTRYPYGIMSIKTTGVADARKICINTINHAYRDWVSDGSKGDFIEFLSKRYDPQTHDRWLKLVKHIMAKRERAAKTPPK